VENRDQNKKTGDGKGGKKGRGEEVNRGGKKDVEGGPKKTLGGQGAQETIWRSYGR